jgi:hypothetical protein
LNDLIGDTLQDFIDSKPSSVSVVS